MALETWHVDPTHSDITFKLRHLVVTEISGHVRRWRGTLRIDPQHPTRSWVEAILDASSIDTGEGERDDHIRSAEFLDVHVFPEITFRSRSISQVEGNRYRVDGELTMRDVTREVTLDMEDLGRKKIEEGVAAASFRLRGTVNRQEFGLHWNQDLDSGGVVLGDKVQVEIAVQVLGRAQDVRSEVDIPIEGTLSARG